MSAFNKFLLFTSIFIAIGISCLYMIGSKRRDFNVEITIASTADQVFSYLVDADKRTLWVDKLNSTKLTQETPNRTFDSVYRIKGEDYQIEEETQLFKPNSLVTLRRKLNGTVTTCVFKLEETSGVTTLSYSIVESREFLASLLYFLEKEDMKNQMIVEMNRLKESIEKSADSSSAQATKLTSAFHSQNNL